MKEHGEAVWSKDAECVECSHVKCHFALTLEATAVHLSDVVSVLIGLTAGNDYRSYRTASCLTLKWIPSNPNRVRCCVESPRSILNHFTCCWQSFIPCIALSCQKSLNDYQNRCVCWRNTSNHPVSTDKYRIGSYSYASEGNRFLKVTYLCCVYKLLTNHHGRFSKMTFRKLKFQFPDANYYFECFVESGIFFVCG